MKLAIHGGPREIGEPLPRAPGHRAARESAAVARLLRCGRSPLARGNGNLALRAEASALLGARYCLPVSSGTAAVHAALAALGVGPGDEVLTSPCTDYGTVAGVFQLGATVVFADLTPDGMGMDPLQVEKKITKRTRVILPVHNGGIPVEMAPILRLARENGIRVVEDAAQAWGARYRGRHVGTIGDAGAFSVNESKHICCGEGGLVVCRSRRVYEQAELFSDKSYDRTGTGRSPSRPALNYRMSEIQAAICREQLKRLPGMVARRHAVGEALQQGLAGIPGLYPVRAPASSCSSYWFFPFWMRGDRLRVSASEFAEALRAEGLPVWVGPQPSVLEWEIFVRLNECPSSFRTYRPVGLRRGAYRPDAYPNAARLATEAFRLSMDESWRMRHVRQALKALAKVAGWYGKHPGRRDRR